MVIYVFVAYAAAVDAGVSMGAFEAFQTLMQEEEFGGLFWKDFAWMGAFTVVGIALEIFDLKRQIKRDEGIR